MYINVLLDTAKSLFVLFLPGCRAGRLDLDESEAEKKKRREEEERQQARIKAMQVHILPI